MAAARELARYKLDLVGCRRLGGTKVAQYEQGIIIFFMEKEMKIIHWEQDFFHTTEYYQHKTAVFVGDMVLYIVLRGRWCNIIILNVHSPSEEKSDDSKDSFHE